MICSDEAGLYNFVKTTTFHFHTTPESIAFLSRSCPNITDSGSTQSCDASCKSKWELIVGLRDSASLTYIDCNTFQQSNISLNEKEWDTHVSFTPLALSVSPCSQFLLVATDKNMHIVYLIGTNKKLRVFAGHSCGDYGKPRVWWDNSGRYVYSNSDNGNSIVVYSVASQRVIATMTGHRSSIRDIAHHHSKNLLVSASFDKTLKVWCASAPDI